MKENFEAITDLLNLTLTTCAVGDISQIVESASRSTPDRSEHKLPDNTGGTMSILRLVR
jgi:hypothetical protein